MVKCSLSECSVVFGLGLWCVRWSVCSSFDRAGCALWCWWCMLSVVMLMSVSVFMM